MSAFFSHTSSLLSLVLSRRYLGVPDVCVWCVTLTEVSKFPPEKLAHERENDDLEHQLQLIQLFLPLFLQCSIVRRVRGIAILALLFLLPPAPSPLFSSTGCCGRTTCPPGGGIIVFGLADTLLVKLSLCELGEERRWCQAVRSGGGGVVEISALTHRVV